MKKLFVRAYCQSNLGDDLFILQLARHCPDTSFYVYALGENQRAFLSQKNICLPTSWDRIRRKLRHIASQKDLFDGYGLDGTVAIGGSIFWEGAPIADLDESCILIGPNCEDSYSPEYREKLAAQLKKVKSCCFRDTFSYKLFEDIPTVSCAPDVLYGWNSRQTPCRGEGIGISLVAEKGAFRAEALRRSYYAAIVEVCDLCAERGIPVTLLGFCKSEGDGEAIRAVLDRVKNPGAVSSRLYEGDPEGMLEAMNGCQTILATRFHAMILGWVLGKNVVPILYSSKQTHVLEDAGFTGPVWNALAGEILSGQALLDMVDAQKGMLDISELKKGANRQFADLDAFLQA